MKIQQLIVIFSDFGDDASSAKGIETILSQVLEKMMQSNIAPGIQDRFVRFSYPETKEKTSTNRKSSEAYF